ncbi:MAG: argininosuccinate lyase [Clostridia bacterium]|nr:argininosuccinate lyase [Clostridia bacterium]
MAKMWAGVTGGETAGIADDFNSSIKFDSRMAKQDIRGSMAHAMMLAHAGIITQAESELIIDGLESILEDLESGKLAIDETSEDIHMFVEQELTGRIGDAGKKLHTARSRNDQVALDLRLYLLDESEEILAKIKNLISAVVGKAEEYKSAIMPGYTHLQRAQPVTFGHHLMAYAMMLLRDTERIKECKKRINVSPIGCCALAGTAYDTDRRFEAEELGFGGICLNSIDGVSDRDFAAELLSDIAILMMHLSRFAEEIVLWSSWEFGFISISDLFITGSSIMPQKKNPDMAELVRGKTGRAYGDLFALLTVLKGLPLAYNKDMQEDKESVFDACDTAKACLDVFAGMICGMTAKTENMRKAAETGFINATDLADYLVGKGLPFRDAYKTAGRIVAECMKTGKVLETFALDDYKAFCPKIEEDVFEAVDLDACVTRRKSEGGTSVGSVEAQIAFVKSVILQ